MMEIKGKRRGGVPLKDKQDRLGEKGLGGWEGNYGTALHEGVIRISRTERVEARSWLAGRRRDNPGGERDHSELPGLATQPGRSPAPVPARLEGKPSSHAEQQPQHPPQRGPLGTRSPSHVLPLVLDTATILQRALLGPPQTSLGSWGVNVTGNDVGGSANGASLLHP